MAGLPPSKVTSTTAWPVGVERHLRHAGQKARNEQGHPGQTPQSQCPANNGRPPRSPSRASRRAAGQRTSWQCPAPQIPAQPTAERRQSFCWPNTVPVMIADQQGNGQRAPEWPMPPRWAAFSTRREASSSVRSYRCRGIQSCSNCSIDGRFVIRSRACTV